MDDLQDKLDAAETALEQAEAELEDAQLIADELRADLAGLDRQCDDLQAIIDARDALLRRALAVLRVVPADILLGDCEFHLPGQIEDALK